MHEFYTTVERKMNYLLYRGYDADGARVSKKVKFRPVLYLDSKKTDTTWKALDGTPVEPTRFDSMSDCRAFTKQYEQIPNFRIHGNDRHIPAFIQSQFPNEIKYDMNRINIVSLDIEYDSSTGFSEPTEAAKEITLIGLKSNKSDRYIVWGCGEYEQEKSILNDVKVEYRQSSCESEMLEDFLSWWEDETNTPDVLTGWNTKTFDMPYMVNRISRVLSSDDALRLSPWKTIQQKTKQTKWGIDTYYEVYGISQLDYLDLFKKFTVNTYGDQESYKLDFIAELVLGENKISYNEEYGSLGELYKKNFNLYVDYNIVDVQIIEKLEEKLGLLSLVFTLAYYGGVNYIDTLGTTAIWDSIIFRYLAKRKIAIPQSKLSSKVDYAGGYVKETIAGRHEWVVSFDLNSLYPSLIIQYNMSPETIVRHMKVPGLTPEKMFNSPDIDSWTPEDNLAISPNGVCFRRDKQGALPTIIEELYKQRVEVKNKMLATEAKLQKMDKSSPEYRKLEIDLDLFSNKQMCLKILLNSCYGAFGSRYFRYYDVDIAEAITLAGQYVVQSVEHKVNYFLSKASKLEKDFVLASDTDSIYIDLSDILKTANPKDSHKFCVDFSKQALEPVIEKTFEEVAHKTNAYKNVMKMKLEKVSKIAIFTKKKRYILNVLSSEGVEYSKPKIVVKGMEAIKSSTPKVCRDKFREVFNVLVEGTEEDVQTLVKDFERDFRNISIEAISFPRSVTSVNKYQTKGANKPYISGTPINSRAAILYNQMLDKKGLSRDLPKIKNGDRLKFAYLRKGNPTNENVIGFVDKLPKEFELHHWIDYDVLFEKTFLHPLDLVLKVIGWKPRPTASLEDFFN